MNKYNGGNMQKKQKKLWEMGAKGGAPVIYDDPKKLWDKCVEYFEWCDSTPLQESKLTVVGTSKTVNKMRAMTVEGLCVFIGIARSTWYAWAETDGRLSDTVDQANSIIREHGISGSCAGLLNSNIIARYHGLTDKKDVTTAGSALTPWSSIEVDDE